MIGCLAALACMGMMSFSSDAGTPASMVQGLSTVVSLPIVFAECSTDINNDFRATGVVPAPSLRIQADDQTDLIHKIHQELQDTDPRSSLAGFNMGMTDLNSFLQASKHVGSGGPSPYYKPPVIEEDNGYISTGGVIAVEAGKLHTFHFSEKVSIDDVYKTVPLVIYCQHQRAETFWKTVAVALGAHIDQLDDTVKIYPNLHFLKQMGAKAYATVGPNFEFIGPIRAEIAQQQLNSMSDAEYQLLQKSGSMEIHVTAPQTLGALQKLAIKDTSSGQATSASPVPAGFTLDWKRANMDILWPGFFSYSVWMFDQNGKENNNLGIP